MGRVVLGRVVFGANCPDSKTISTRDTSGPIYLESESELFADRQYFTRRCTRMDISL